MTLHPRQRDRTAPREGSRTAGASTVTALSIVALPIVTDASTVEISGTKEAHSGLRIDDEDAEADFSSTAWSVMLDLTEGKNSWSFSAVDEVGNESAGLEIVVVRGAVAFSVNEPVARTRDSIITMSGSRGNGVAVWLSGNEVVAPGIKAPWSHDVELTDGVNSLVPQGMLQSVQG